MLPCDILYLNIVLSGAAGEILVMLLTCPHSAALTENCSTCCCAPCHHNLKTAAAIISTSGGREKCHFHWWRDCLARCRAAARCQSRDVLGKAAGHGGHSAPGDHMKATRGHSGRDHCHT
ncbi:hypothetical protein E2C01_015360 [Portunus trituberculatus]|uniref:Secreted protein n=1 Tax=Portunus trituberculatus TaxID=210409 RepID=A0A5B7DLM4_PORTR|nr:hypothetical protein [Portunus trituberculatus]